MIETEKEAEERLKKSRNLGLCQNLSLQYKACYLEGITPNQRAQQFDGGYFENLTSLDWRKTIKRASKRQFQQIEDLPEPSNLEDIPESQGDSKEVVQDGKPSTLSDKQREALYCEAVYTIMYQIGGQNKQLSNGDLYVYLQEVLKISSEQHRKLYDKTKQRESPKFYLKVQVAEARNLQAKDANGLSDPYCMIGIIKSQVPEETKPKIKRKFSKTLQEILKTESIQMTTVRENTINPTWNETFSFEVDDIVSDILHIDIWDCDDKDKLTDHDNKITKIRGFHGVGRYLKDVVQSARAGDNESTDDFLGYLEVPLKNINSDGINEWFSLKTKSSKCRVSGDCNVKISLSSGTRPDFHDDIHNLYTFFPDLYAALLLEFVRYDVETSQMTEGLLSAPAEYILHQLAVQNDLTPLQEAAIRWRFYSEFHWTNPLQYDTLCLLAHKLAKQWTPGRLSDREERALRKNLKQFVENSLQLILKHRELYPPTDKGRFGRLVNLVECLEAVTNMDAYSSEEEKDALCQSIDHVIKESASAWYDKTHAWLEPRESTNEAKLSFIIDLSDAVLTDFLKGLKFYQKVFRLVGVDYFSVTYCQLELMLANDLRIFLESLKQSIKNKDEGDIVGEKLFALYLAVRELMGYRQHTKIGEEHTFGLDDFHLWFKTVVLRWFDIAHTKAKNRIKKAVTIDKFLCVDSSVMYSTSAVDCTGCFHQIREFWKRLDWPDAVGSYMYVTQIISMICSSALYYADLVFKKMVEENYYDNDPTQFDVVEELCVTLNDIEYIRTWLSKLPEMMDLDGVVVAMKKVHGEKGGKHVNDSITSVVNSADEDMMNKIGDIIEHIGLKMAVDVKRFVIKLSWEQNPKDADEAISPLLQYLDDNLMVLNKSLMKSVFELMLSYMWEIVIESFNNMNKSGKGNPCEFYVRLRDAIEIVKTFFHADGAGLPINQLTDGLYKSLMDSLDVRCMTTPQLIEMFFEHLCERQKEAPEKFGAITVRSFYDLANTTVHIEVLNARNLVALDTNGLSDPYVVLRLLPCHLYSTRLEQKSKVVKNSLFPLYDEKFSFSVPVDVCKRKSACLCLTILDYDVLSNDDIEGFAVLPLNVLPGLDEQNEGSFSNEPQITLNLMHPRLEGIAFETLECRNDKKAEQFVKEQRVLLQKVCSAHPSQFNNV